MSEVTKQLSFDFSPVNHYFFSDGKEDFLVFNADKYKINDEPIYYLLYFELKENNVLSMIKSCIWSCGLIFGFVFQQEGIYLINISDKTVCFCNKHTTDFFDIFLKAP